MGRVVLGAVESRPNLTNLPELLPTASEIHQNADLLPLWDSTSRQHVRVTPAQLAGSGGFVFLNSVTATGATISSGSFASVATSYIAVQAVAVGIRTATTSTLGIRTSSDGTNYAATADSYAHGSYRLTATATALVFNTASTDTAIVVIPNLATGVGAALSGQFVLSNLNATATSAFPHLRFSGEIDTTNEIGVSTGGGRRKEAIAQGGLQLMIPAGGSFIDGRVDFFGIKGA